MEVATAIVGLILLVASPLLLSRAWRRGVAGRPARLAGWAALLLAMAAFGFAFGSVRGPALALALLPVPALAPIVARRDRSVRRVLPERARSAPVKRRTLRAMARFLVAVPLSAIAAVLVAAQMARLFGSMTAGIVTGLAFGVLLWAVGTAWAVIDPRLRRPAGGIALAALAGAAPLLLR